MEFHRHTRDFRESVGEALADFLWSCGMKIGNTPLGAGFDYYVCKPVEPLQINAAVNNLIQKK